MSEGNYGGQGKGMGSLPTQEAAIEPHNEPDEGGEEDKGNRSQGVQQEARVEHANAASGSTRAKGGQEAVDRHNL